jgi:soluble cytochrome b562
MHKDQYHKKLATYLLLVASATFLASNSFAKTEPPKTHPATTVDRVAVATKHKVLSEKARSIESEAAKIEAQTHKAILALGNKDTKGATAILQAVSTKLDNLIAKNPGLELVPTAVDIDVSDYEGTNKEVASAIDEAEDLLKQGRLQTARRIVLALTSEIRVTTTSIPLGTYPAAIKQIIPLIDSGKVPGRS